MEGGGEEPGAGAHGPGGGLRLGPVGGPVGGKAAREQMDQRMGAVEHPESFLVEVRVVEHLEPLGWVKQ